MTITVTSGVTSSGLTFSSGLSFDPSVVIDSGGTIESSTVLDTGYAILSFGAIISGLTVDSGGIAAFSGDLNSDFTWSGGEDATNTSKFDGVIVSSGGGLFIDDASVMSGATLSLTSGALAYGVTISSGGAVLGAGAIFGGPPGDADYIYGSLGSGVAVEGIYDVASGAHIADREITLSNQRRLLTDKALQHSISVCLDSALLQVLPAAGRRPCPLVPLWRCCWGPRSQPRWRTRSLAC